MELSKVGAYSGLQGYWAIWDWMGFPAFSLGSCCISGKPGGPGVLSLRGGSLVSTLVSHILRSGQLAFSDNSCKQQANTDCLAPLSSLSWHLDYVKKEWWLGQGPPLPLGPACGPQSFLAPVCLSVGGRKDPRDLSFHLCCRSLLDSLAFPPYSIVLSPCLWCCGICLGY